MGQKHKKLDKQNGYTIIETMIAVSIFLVVIMVGMSALLNADLIHKKSGDMRSIMDNLSFVMEDISRNLRTGYSYHCIDDGNLNAIEPRSCLSGNGISFKSDAGDRIKYIIGSDIQKSMAGGSYVELTSPEIVIDPSSHFTVVGAELSDTLQPFVTIKLVGKITYRSIETPFSLQTSVSQRSLDVP